MEHVLGALTSKTLTYEQRVFSLAKEAEDNLDMLPIPTRTKEFFEAGALDDLFKGHAPYRPRYIMPDYKKFVEQGSEFLRLDPPKTLDELLSLLQALYHHVPSITGSPVYLGELDAMIEPFLNEEMMDEEIKRKPRLFLIFLGRTITDSFCHTNLGSRPTRAGKLVLELERDLQSAVPNLTSEYGPEMTANGYAQLATYTSLFCANPAVCGDTLNRDAYPCGYGTSSYYNILPIGGGAYILSRITLTELVRSTESIKHFLSVLLPECPKAISDYINARVAFLVEQSGFFESSLLVREELIQRDKFVGMFGVTGLAECVSHLVAPKGLRYGHSREADDLGVQIMNVIEAFVAEFLAICSGMGDSHLRLHAQMGLDGDKGITSGVRIPVGDESEKLFDHLRHSARFYHYFSTGVDDIFPLEVIARKNPVTVLDMMKGTFRLGIRYISFYASDSGLVRIIDFLVKRSEMEKYRSNDMMLQNTAVLGSKNYDTNQLAKRKMRS